MLLVEINEEEDFNYAIEQLDVFMYPVLLTAHNSNWRGQTGTAEASSPEEALRKALSFDGTTQIHYDPEEEQPYFMVYSHDVPTGFSITIEDIGE